MQQILILWDYLSIYQLREKYGRHRPWCSSLAKKLNGWQKMWWHYAQKSVLSNVHRKLRETSWSYLGWRMSYRRKYVNLYKKKLDFLWQEQPVDKAILLELERMEKESDIDDILSYRSIAERESQEFLSSSTSPNMEKNSGNISSEKQQNDDGSSTKSRGWLNWLSLGMLGAGGTEDSIQFSGVVSDEIIKDIYEVTEFHPAPSVDGGGPTKYRIYSSIKFNVHSVIATFNSKAHKKEAVKVIFDEVIIECKHREESCTFIFLVNSLEMANPYNKNVVLLARSAFAVENFQQPSITVQVDMSLINCDSELSVKAVLQPIEVTYDSDFLLNLWDFLQILGSFKFHHERVMLSLNGFENIRDRLLSKAEYTFLHHTKIIWDVSFGSIMVQIPWRCEDSKLFFMRLELGAITFKSRVETESLALEYEHQRDCSHAHFQYSASSEDLPEGVPLQDLYNHFEVLFTDFKANVVLPDSHQAMYIFERCDGAIALASCIIPDESMLKQLEVQVTTSALDISFSSSIYGALVGMIQCLDIPKRRLESVMQEEPSAGSVFNFSVTAKLEGVSFHVNVTDDAESSLVLFLVLGELEMEYNFLKFVEYHIRVKTLNINMRSSRSETCSHTLCASRDISLGNSALQHETGVGIDTSSYARDERNVLTNGCFLLHYQTRRSEGIVSHKYKLWLNDVDLLFFPAIFGLLLKFCNKLSGYDTYPSACPGMKSFGANKESKDAMLLSAFDLQGFGFSNFCEPEFNIACIGIPLDQFPFIGIHNSGSLSSLERSLIYGISEWKRGLKVWDKNSATRITKSSVGKKSQMSSMPTVKPPYSHASLVLGNCDDADVLFLDLNLNRIKAHFHDASCILGTVTLPITKSLLLVRDSDYLDMLCSFEGLLVSSSWSTQDCREVLWGPSVSNLSPILNIRLRKEKCGSLIPQIQVSISIQHVCCVLLADFLAILIGYFSLPDWTSNGSEPCVIEDHKREDTVTPYSIIYKFEILDSLLIFPVESSKYESLHLDLQQLYCSFRPRISLEDAFEDVPPECMVPSQKVTGLCHHLNVFGRDLYLSLVLLKDSGCISVKLDQDSRNGNISLIAPINTDLWIRIPCDSNCFCELSPATCIMVKIQNCQVVVKDDHFIFGVEAILDVIDQLSLVRVISEGFTSDVLQFLQFNRSLKEGNLVWPMVSSVSFTEVRFFINSMSINLYRYMRSHTDSSQLVAKADMQFNLCASFRDYIPLILGINFSYLVLLSFYGSTLVECTPEGPSSSGLVIRLSRSDRGVNVILVDVPSAHIWLHLSDWSEVIDLLVSYSRKLSGTSSILASKTNSNSFLISVPVSLFQNDPQSARTSSSISSDEVKDNVDLILKSEKISISFHFPLSAKEEAFGKCREEEHELKMPSNFFLGILGERNMHGAEHCKYIALILHGKDFELVISGHHAKLKCCMEKIKGVSETIEEQRILSWTLFQLFRVHVSAEIYDKEQKQHADADIRIDSLNVCSSQKIFYFWHGIEFKIPRAGSSQLSIFSMVMKVHFRKASFLLTDGKWSCGAPLLEILLKNLLLHTDTTESATEASVAGDLVVNYKNIHTVLWEPFVEPWTFELKMIRKHRQSALLNTFVTTDIDLKSGTPLNLNFTEALIEVIFRVNELVNDVRVPVGVNDCPESQRFVGCQSSDNVHTRYAPYILQNETSLPLSFQVYHGLAHSDNFDMLAVKEGNIVHPGSSIPIYIDETPEEHAFHSRPLQSSDRLNDKSLNGVANMISIKLDGTSGPSIPLSMDLVGVNYFEVNFSKASGKVEVEKNEDSRSFEERNRKYPNSGFVVPVVFDVSVQQYSKLVRLYSTVILLNSTSMPLELRFDIPFGVSPKVLDPIHPSQEFPLPLHLAEAGLMRWRPLGNSYLWSEAQLLSNILSLESKPGFLRSFVCYPSHPSSDPFRCCISIQHISLPSSTGPKEDQSFLVKASRQSLEDQDHRHSLENLKKRFIHYVTLTTPLFVRNYLPNKVSLTIESGGVTRTIVLSEVGSASIFYIDSTHDLGLVFHVHGFSPGSSKFPRAETFATLAKFNDAKFSLSETFAIYPDLSNGPIYITVEKVLDALCGARELCISVPFLLYNCTGLPLTVAGGNEIEENSCSIPSCYHLIELHKILSKKHGLSFVPSEQDSHVCNSTSKTPRFSAPVAEYRGIHMFVIRPLKITPYH